MENVSGMVQGKMKVIFADILRTLKGCGYRVSARLLDAQYFGVPQQRQRLIFIGVREDLGIEPSHPKAQTRPISVKQAIGKQGYIEYRHNYSVGEVQWGRADFDRPCLTITKTGMGWRTCIDGECRRFTISELKRLASFPDNFVFLGTFKEQWARIGNSVPPNMMKAIAEHIVTTILLR
jgi:DNA (cytosine-5)-methyltransferase 1